MNGSTRQPRCARLVGCVLALGFTTLAPAAQAPIKVEPPPQVPAKIPGTPEEQIFNLYQRVAALEQELKGLQYRLAATEATSYRQSQALGELAGRINELRLDAEAKEKQTNIPSPEAPRERVPENTVLAPFTVVDENGGPILQVRAGAEPSVVVFGGEYGKAVALDSRGVSYFNKSGKAVARLGGLEGAGEVLVGTPTGEVSASLVGSAEGPALALQMGNGAAIANLNRYGFTFYRPSGGAAALLGVEKDGSGLLQLSNAAGTPSVEAGADPDGIGWVHTGPLYRCMAMAGPTVMVGAVPDCLRGKLK